MGFSIAGSDGIEVERVGEPPLVSVFTPASPLFAGESRDAPASLGGGVIKGDMIESRIVMVTKVFPDNGESLQNAGRMDYDCSAVAKCSATSGKM